MLGLSRFTVRRDIDAWRDRWQETALHVLTDSAASIGDALESELSGVDWRSALFRADSHMRNRVDPYIREVGEPVAHRIVEEANRELTQIVQHRAVWHASPTPSDPGGAGAGWDVVKAGAPLAAGSTLAVALPGMAVTTTSAWFGLVTVTAVSWPVVIGGATLAGTLALFGFHRLKQMPEGARHRLAQRIRARVSAVMLEGPVGNPSVLQRIAGALAEAAERAKRG